MLLHNDFLLRFKVASSRKKYWFGQCNVIHAYLTIFRAFQENKNVVLTCLSFLGFGGVLRIFFVLYCNLYVMDAEIVNVNSRFITVSGPVREPLQLKKAQKVRFFPCSVSLFLSLSLSLSFVLSFFLSLSTARIMKMLVHVFRRWEGSGD